MAFLFLRLSPDTKHRVTAYVIAGTATVLMVVSVFLAAIKCGSSQPWIFVGEQRCDGMVSAPRMFHGERATVVPTNLLPSVRPVASHHDL